MNTITKICRILVPTLLVFILSACKGVGIFSTLAITEKVDDGALPEGISSEDGVLYAASWTGSTDWAYFSTGPGLWVKDITDRSNSWSKVSLPAGYSTIQSIAASDTLADNAILFSAVGEDGSGDRIVSLFYIDSIDSGTGAPTYSSPIITWTTTDDTYHNAKVFWDGSASFYINLLIFDGEYRDDDSELSASELYSTSNPSGGIGSDLGFTTMNTSSNFRYLSGVANGGSGTFFTVIDEDGENGLLLNSSGTDVGITTKPVTGITWLDDAGAYIMGVDCITGANGAVFVSSDGSTWHSVEDNDDDDSYISFVDVSGVSGSSWVLAGRDICGEDGGYEEINVSGDIADWYITNDYDFADYSNYTSTDMPDVSVTDFTIIDLSGSGGDITLYASTRFEGIFSLDIGSIDNDWEEE